MDTLTDLSLPSRDRRPGLCPSCALTVDETACDDCGSVACGCSICQQMLDLLMQPGATALRASGFAVFGCVGEDETCAEALKPYVPDVAVAEPPPVASEKRPWYASADDVDLEPDIAMTETSILCRGLLGLCGLSGVEAEILLGQKPSTIRKKSAGAIPFVPADIDRLRALWKRIEANDQDLVGGPREAAQALALLRTTAL